MSKKENKEHLSEIHALLYCDKELVREDRLKMDKHLKDCDKCRQLVEKTRSFSNILSEAVKNDLSTERKEDCISDMDISAYLENQISSEERMTLEEHISKCEYCLIITAETKRSIVEGITGEEPHFSYEKIMGAVKQQLREKRVENILEEFNILLKESPLNIQKSLKGIKDNIEDMFKNTFAYPSPRFAPVFGEHEANVLSPFGKVRYPITFEWLPYEKADHYLLLVEDIDWSFNTSETRVEITAKYLKLNYENEYMWELKVMRGKEVIDEITGFFSLASKAEIKELMGIEEQLKGVGTEQDKLILWGGILEEKRFYMEAIDQYKKAYASEPLDGIAYRIAYCYDRLELEELRNEWNKRIQH